MPLPARTELVGDPDWLESLLDATANGTSLLAWARIEGNPAARTVNKWCKDREDIKSRLAHARVSGGEHRMEEIIVAARGPAHGYDGDHCPHPCGDGGQHAASAAYEGGYAQFRGQGGGPKVAPVIHIRVPWRCIFPHFPGT